MTVLLVRHANAGRRSAWRGDDRLRPLTKRGRIQAQGLVSALAPWPDALLVSSPWLRCTETLGPVSREWGRAVAEDDILGEGMGTKAWERYSNQDRDVALCTHGDVIEETLLLLVDAGTVLEDRFRAAKGSVWVIEQGRARYLAPV